MLASLWIAIAALVMRPAPGQTDEDLRVTLDGFVTDGRGRPVAGLTREDFEIVEEGVSRPIESVTSAPESVTLFLLLDSSNSMAENNSAIRTAVPHFLRGLPASDRARVGFFNEKLQVSPDFTDDAEALAGHVHSVTPSGWTLLHDAILRSLELLAPIEGRKALLLLSDGNDSESIGMGMGSEASRNDVFESVRRSSVLVYPVGIRASTTTHRINRAFLSRLSEESGSRFQLAVSISDLSRALEQIEEDVHGGYRLVFRPLPAGPDGKWRPVEVRVKDRKDLTVRTRRGFYVESAGAH